MAPSPTRIRVGTPDDGPYALARDHRGRLWTSMVQSGRLARVDVDGPMFIDLGNHDCRPTQLATAADGSLWCTRYGDDRLERVDPDTGARTTIALPVGTEPYGVTAGLDSTVWFTAIGSESVGRVDTDGTVSFVELSEPGMPSMITRGADGGVWFTLHNLGAVARLDPATASIVVHRLADPQGGPVGITPTANGLWCPQIRAGRVAHIGWDGAVREFDLPDRKGQPHAAAATPDGGCWVTLWGSSGLVRLRPDGTAYAMEVLDPDDHPHGVLVDGDTVWVAADRGDLVGVQN